MMRISEHFYKTENYKVAAQVGEKFLERFEGHEWAPKMAFRVGQCYYKGKQYAKAARRSTSSPRSSPTTRLCADALFWSGESYRMANNAKEAFRRYNHCRWDIRPAKRPSTRPTGPAGNAATVRGRSDHRRMTPAPTWSEFDPLFLIPLPSRLPYERTD